MATKAKPWLCRCGHRNDPAHRKCRDCAKAKPPKRVTPHKRLLKTVGYEEWERKSFDIHGGVYEYGACGVCGRMPIGNRHDRDHDHETGNIRGLACTGQFGCNAMMPRKLTAEKAWRVARLMATDADAALALAPYLPRDLTPERAHQVAAYLARVDAYYQTEGESRGADA